MESKTLCSASPILVERCERIATALDLEDLKTLTGLALLPLSQEWRREEYPWPGAEPSPLVESLAF